MIQQDQFHQALPSRAALLKRAQGWASVLLDGPVSYFPVRHHSPACAKHLALWIDRFQPKSIIVEAPCSLNQWLPALASEDCIGPVAMLTTYRESDEIDTIRHSAFYPLCDYSPEWVAIRKGSEVGAKVQFADLEFSDKVNLRAAAHSPNSLNGEGLLGVLLAEENNLRYSQFIQQLVRRMGCRGASYHESQLVADATFAREEVMARVIGEEIDRLKPKQQGTILVVTGGFHTVALPSVVEATKPGKKAKGNKTKRSTAKENQASDEMPTAKEVAPELTDSWLLRYSYDQLDALAGYQSGMPSPGFYDAIWQAEKNGTDHRRTVSRLISEIARETRGKSISHEASVTDSIAAVEMTDQLANLRGNLVPTRSDVRDAVFSCMQKEASAGSDLLSLIVDRVLAGNRVGVIPPSTKLPPLIDDFQRSAAKFRLPWDEVTPQTITLELYRKPAHRKISFWLHQLQLLSVPYASLVAGPDFIHGHRINKLTEQWTVAWAATTDARLSELSALGDTLENAATTHLLRRANALDDDGETRKDAHFASVALGLSRLMLLQSAREPLEAERLTSLKELIVLFFQRATALVEGLGTVPDEALGPSLDGLMSIREILASLESPEETDAVELDADLYFQQLQRLIRPTGEPARSEIAGAAAGLLFGGNRIDDTEVCQVVSRYLDASVDNVDDACGVIRGLVMTGREVFWQLQPLLASIDRLFSRWEEDRFIHALPNLRLAFSQLAPKEIDAVGKRVAELNNVDEIGPLQNPDITEPEMIFAAMINSRMNESLERDGLK